MITIRRVPGGHMVRIRRGVPPVFIGDSAIPLCSECHKEQHRVGEDAIGGKDKVDKLRLEHVKRWAWERMREIFGVESMREADPIVVRSWAQLRGIDRHLPTCYRSAA